MSEAQGETLGNAGAVAAGGAALTLAAFAFDASPLFVPGVALILLGTLTPAWVWLASRSARIERRLHAVTAIEDEPVEATIAISRGPLGLPGAQVVDPLAGESLPLGSSLSPIGGSRRVAIHVVAHFSRRGRKRLEPPMLRIKDPLELAVVVRPGASDAQEVLVLPRTEPVRWIAGGSRGRTDRSALNAALEAAPVSQPDGLRPYRLGAPASRIHWPALARGAGLLERRFGDESDTRPIVVLDTRSQAGSEQLDAAVRAAASLTLELSRRGGCGLLLPGERRPIEIDRHLGAWPGVHARLAVVEGGPGVRPPALGHLGGLAGIFYVAAQPLARLPLAVSRNAHIVTTLVLPRPAAPTLRSVPVFDVAGCRGFLLAGERRSIDVDRASGGLTRPPSERASMASGGQA
jgi:uncharacterized protein (DUF58 family)